MRAKHYAWIVHCLPYILKNSFVMLSVCMCIYYVDVGIRTRCGFNYLLRLYHVCLCLHIASGILIYHPGLLNKKDSRIGLFSLPWHSSLDIMRWFLRICCSEWKKEHRNSTFESMCSQFPQTPSFTASIPYYPTSGERCGRRSEEGKEVSLLK